MSEYQYHEWQSIDRSLTPEERKAVSELSSHIAVSSNRAWVEYHWRSFRHDRLDVLLQYFDAYLYYANWGSIYLMFRFPKGILDTEAIESYCDEENVRFETYDEYQVLSIEYNYEWGIWSKVEGVELSDFVQLREELIEGDYRLLYLAWLLKYGPVEEGEEYQKDDDEAYVDEAFDDDFEGDDDEEQEETSKVHPEQNPDDLEPPVPAGLKKLSPALARFMDVFGVSRFMVEAAAENSPDLEPASQMIPYRNLISGLSRVECDEFLARLAEGDGSVRAALRRRLSEFQPKEAFQSTDRRTALALINRAAQLENEEKERMAEEARRKYIAEMEFLASREPQIWQQVDDMLRNGRRIASVYQEATGLLVQLKRLAEYQNNQAHFAWRMRDLANQYIARPALIERWKKNNLL
jgi:hypothetical protein